MKQISFWINSDKISYIHEHVQSEYFNIEKVRDLPEIDMVEVIASYNPDLINLILLDIFHAGTIYGIDYTFKKNLKPNATTTQNSK